MTVRIYNSKGYELTERGQSQDQDKRIEDFFFAGVRAAFDVSTPQRAEVTVYFRARNASDGGVSGRANQYFATLEASSNQTQLTANDISSLAATTAQQVKQRCEELSLSLETSIDDMEVFRQLTKVQPANPTSNFDGEVAEYLLNHNQRPRYGVTDERRGVSLLAGFLAATDAQSGVIADQVDHSVVSQYEIGFQPDASQDFTPIGDTSSHVEQAKRDMQAQLAERELSSIEESVKTLQQDAGLSKSELRSRVTSRVPALKAPTTQSTSNSEAMTFDATSSNDDDLLSKLPLKAIGAVAAVVLLLGAGVVGASMFGLVPGLLGGGDTGEPSLSLSVNQTGANNVAVSGTVSNVSSPTTVNVSFTNGEFSNSKSLTVDQSGKFSTNITGLSHGEWNITAVHQDSNASDTVTETIEAETTTADNTTTTTTTPTENTTTTTTTPTENTTTTTTTPTENTTTTTTTPTENTTTTTTTPTENTTTTTSSTNTTTTAS
ncbi:uncharacterized protein HfgLR_12595 [Haloferax gibbonsii]|uniref:Uncharacterized protein n=1 Tax=Haloferax gibbonsii TaxID=35746 RepID=A0A871BIQ3_HALGI|nr:hypothetical protein [Haloferax gibbonsii]QOS12655.1 uncharacterized protein HfgLR_12595 [Haloferax gibbonsii]